MEGRIAVRTYDAQTVLTYRLCLAAADKEGDISSSISQTAAEIATDGASADYQYAHRRIMWDSCFPPQLRGMWDYPREKAAFRCLPCNFTAWMDEISVASVVIGPILSYIVYVRMSRN